LDDASFERSLDAAVEIVKVLATLGAAYFAYRAMDR